MEKNNKKNSPQYKEKMEELQNNLISVEKDRHIGKKGKTTSELDTILKKHN